MDDIEYKKLLKKFLIPVLRRATYRWSQRSEALRNARVDRGLYKCANCELTFKNKEIQLDHKIPVVPLDLAGKEQTWDSYIERLFCRADGFSVLCFTCHDIKSKMEVEIRKQNRKKAKEEKKNLAKSKKK